VYPDVTEIADLVAAPARLAALPEIEAACRVGLGISLEVQPVIVANPAL
jgi:hypothetical protein